MERNDPLNPLEAKKITGTALCAKENSPETTSGYSSTWGDCVCPEGSALVERSSDGAYLAAKKCVRCASGISFSLAWAYHVDILLRFVMWPCANGGDACFVRLPCGLGRA